MSEIKLFGVNMSAGAVRAVESVLYSGYVGEGKTVTEFESAIARFIGVEPKRVVTVNSCTSALTIALRLAGVEGASERVASTPMTCLATNEPVLSLGASVDWCDVEPETGNLDPKSIDSAVWKDTVALMCVHWGGQPCKLSEIQEKCNKYGLVLIEDAAHAFGSEYNGRLIGNNTSDFTCFSFQAIKHLTCVDGGALVCARLHDAERARLMRWYGLNRGAGDKLRCLQDPPEWGWKFHMNNVNAAIGLANLDEIGSVLARCREIAGRYDAELKGKAMLRAQPRFEGALSAYWLYTALADDSETFIKFMAARGIETGRVHGRNDNKRIFAGSLRELPGVDSFEKCHVCLPCRAGLTNDEVERVCSAIAEYDFWETHKNGKYSVTSSRQRACVVGNLEGARQA